MQQINENKIMIRNYIKIAVRNMLRHPTYAVINIIGLSIGVVFSLLLLLFILDEVTYDKFHKKSNRTYRIAADVRVDNTEIHIPTTMAPLGPTMTSEYSGVEGFLRVLSLGETLVITGNEEFYEEDIYFADSSFFNFFDFSLKYGEPDECLVNPNSIVITDELAKKYFGEENPIGKIIKTGGEEKGRTITGVMAQLPSNSHMRPKGLISYSSLPAFGPQDWGSLNDHTYILLKEGYEKDSINIVFDQTLVKYIEPMFKEFDAEAEFYLQPISSIHLHSDLQGEISTNGDIYYIYIFGSIAVFMLLIASINYMNLSTARSASRSKEVGVRKALGSSRIQLIWQFMAESILITMLSVIISSIIVFFLLPAFNELTKKSIPLNFVTDPIVILGLLGIILFVGVIGGSYPSFFLSKFKAVEVLKGKGLIHNGNATLRKVLVITQFSISLVMIICTWVVFDQLQFVQDKNLGFNKNQVLKIPLNGKEVMKKYNVLRNQLLAEPNIEAVGSGDSTPGGRNLSMSGIKIESDNGQLIDKVFQNITIDNEYLNTLEIPIVLGRNFSTNIAKDTSLAILVNEEMVRHMGWIDPIGKKVIMLESNRRMQAPSRVVGVVKNYHILSLQEPISPLVIHNSSENGNLLIRIKPTNVASTIEYIKKTWSEIVPNRPFELNFLEQEFAKQYETEQKRGEVFGIFALFTILISCLGLFGLASFTAEKRSKEISIRKVAGAGIGNIVLMMSKDFLKLVFVSVLISFPIAYLVMNQWLEEFAFRIDISPMSFVFSAILTILIAFITISYHSISSAMSNPTRALKE
ncbi:MAG: putative ABC transport system permease protein [Cyclobacteriaceae bacterium]